MRVYISRSCTNCLRLLEGIDRVPSLRGKIQVLDIDRLPPDQKRGLQFVPTLVDDYETQYIGSRAFEFLKQYDGEVELEAAPMGMGLAFSSLQPSGTYGGMQYVERYGDFTAPD